jgi:FlaG/FlaF family flagellin (archaellin)
MEKAGSKRAGAPQSQARGKAKTSSSAPPKAATKVVKVVASDKSDKKERMSSRPPNAANATVVAAVPRVEPVRLHGSEHGAAVSKTDHLKARFSALNTATAQIKALKRSIQKNFFDIGLQLGRIRDEKLYEVKGYGSFESFLEREMDLDKVTCMRLARLARSMVREAAIEVGMERACAAMAALEGEMSAPSSSGTYPVSGAALNTLPAHKR